MSKKLHITLDDHSYSTLCRRRALGIDPIDVIDSKRAALGAGKSRFCKQCEKKLKRLAIR